MDQKKINLIGKVDATLCYEKKNSQQELHIIKDLTEPLLVVVGGQRLKL